MNRKLLLRLAACALVAFSFAAVPSFAWWYLVDGRPPAATTVPIDIPTGTAEQIAAGSQPPSLPSSLHLRADDMLLIHNLDVVTHQLGSVTIPSGEERLVSAGLFVAAGKSQFLCTFHSTGSLSLSQVESSSPLNALIVTVVVAIPLALAAFVVLAVTERLQDESPRPLATIPH